MIRNRKSTPGSSLTALYDRLDEVRMSDADRASAKAALAQADALADNLLAVAHFAKRLLGALTLRPSSAH